MANTAPIQVLSVDDHPLLREGLTAIVNSQSDMSIVATAASGTEGIKKFREIRPDVTLMDLRLPDLSGIEVIIAIRSEFPHARVIVLTTSQGDAEIRRALQAGAYGYMLKASDPQYMLDTIRQVHAGKKRVSPEVAAGLVEYMGDDPLSRREVDVLKNVVDGNRNRDIANKLFISEETVKVHLKHIMGKLGASDRTGAVAIAIRRGIIVL